MRFLRMSLLEYKIVAMKKTLIIPNPTWGKIIDLLQTHGHVKIDTPSSDKLKRIIDVIGLSYETEQLEGELTKFTLNENTETIEKMTLEEFAKANVPNIQERLEVYNSSPQDLIGRKVSSIRSGFSNTGGGQIMIIDSADEKRIHFIHCEESYLGGENNKINHRGWGCDYSDRHNSFIFYKEK